MKKHMLIMDNPAHCWENATAVGNGSVGAMVFGDTVQEKLYLNEESIWSGNERETVVSDFRTKVDYIRQMYFDGKIGEIDEWAEKNLTQGIERIKSYEYAGILNIDFFDKTPATGYSRRLFLNSAVAEISYNKKNNRITETVFSSYPDKLTAVKISGSRELSFLLSYMRENTISCNCTDGVLLALAHTAYGEHGFAVGVKITTDGETSFSDGKLTVTDARETVLYISIATEFKVGGVFEAVCCETLRKAGNYEEIMRRHIDDFSALFERSDITFSSAPELEKMTAGQRLKRLREDENAEDAGLYSLYFAFGKYLLLSSSREGTLPANLQGIWVEKEENPWNADYHTNINLQMNYWLAEIANLSGCHMQLFDYMNNYLLKSGMHTAQLNYRCRGTVVHHLSDIYSFTTPADGLWGVWPMGGAWLSTHMWEHYLFTLDTEYLRSTAYEYMHQCALFFVDYMFEGKNGFLLTGPSMSPENNYYIDTPSGRKKAYLTFSPTMDVEIVRCVLNNYIQAEKLLNINAEHARQAEQALVKLPPLKIGKHGQLMEWLEDYDEPEPGHRHISHAFALYPDCSVTRKTPELFAAVRATLERRLSFGGGHTGWSRAWLINLYARLKDAGKTYENIRALMTKSTIDNLFDVHPPFQIDGNFGGSAGIAESLLQSHEGFISLLPAVPKWLTGSFNRLMARGNIEVSAVFENGRVESFTLFSPESKTVLIELPTENGAEIYNGDSQTRSENGLYQVELIAGVPAFFRVAG